ncbi:hypothetical protein AVEN_181102-1 [Araneus ventricosus]|uniref:Uncharacterized protein n=1 Tax=Araneus ventricosus TaxID=182803 RepID=A0A4Y2QFF5_ARAVE|nr:hypothetical protein AVEN_181102-1 [Araneus ventricosus]
MPRREKVSLITCPNKWVARVSFAQVMIFFYPVVIIGNLAYVENIVDGAPAVPSDVGCNVAYIWMLPSTTSFVILAWLLAHASSFATDFTSAFSYWAYL